MELINRTISLETAREDFPIGKPVEVISGAICTAQEYVTRDVTRDDVMDGMSEFTVEVWGTIEHPER